MEKKDGGVVIGIMFLVVEDSWVIGKFVASRTE